ncbi:hypothetical protein ACIRU3_35640 [Streptomyces sp. NPDC101151]|uniref:hypothetical protein n=1 Tax=Streptomyces sp. NPDC101151 TaxID=3366115 RepID=UPI0038115A7D
MTGQGGAPRRRWWRWAVRGWAVAVAAGGGFTLWLQGSVRPHGPYVRENGDGSEPRNAQDGTPGPFRGTGADDDGCPPDPEPGSTRAPGAVQVVCAYAATAP